MLKEKSSKKIIFNELSLREKICQMVMVGGRICDKRFLNLGIGGIFLPRFNSKEVYESVISRYQNISKIKLFFSADMEGFLNPFDKFYKSSFFGEVKNKKEAYSLGKEQGKLMNELGFNMNFSPVVEVRNNVWHGRSFTGSLEEVKSKINGYIQGLQEEGIIATAKHYPGGSMVKDPHKLKYATRIFEEDLKLFDEAIKSKVKAVMVGHPVVYGAVNSRGKQCTISKEIVSGLRNKFRGLIITDAISMMGLRWSYLFRFNKIYIDLIKAGNDIILDLNVTYGSILKRIRFVEDAVKKGKISKERIDESVKRILKAKGYHLE